MNHMTKEQKFLAASDQLGSEAIAAGYSLSEAIAAGYSLSEEEALLSSVPLIERPYSRLLADIQANLRDHRQSTFGPEEPTDDEHICGTAMCTAGHLIQMAGAPVLSASGSSDGSLEILRRRDVVSDA